MTQSRPHLWEIDHPYYCTEGNYYKNGMHEVYDSWAGFYEDWGTNDPELNLVFRWDWQRDDGEFLEEGETPGPDVLKVFWVLQRKAILRSTECVVTEADEPAVLAWLQDRARTITAIWEPIALAAPPRLCDCGAEIPAAERKAYCGDRCRWADQDHGSDDVDGGEE